MYMSTRVINKNTLWQGIRVGFLVLLCCTTVFRSHYVIAYNRGDVKYCPKQLRTNTDSTGLINDPNVQNAYKSFQSYLFNKTNVLYNNSNLVDVTEQNNQGPLKYALEVLLTVPLIESESIGLLKCCVIVSQISEGNRISSDVSRVFDQEGKSYLIEKWMCGDADDKKPVAKIN